MALIHFSLEGCKSKATFKALATLKAHLQSRLHDLTVPVKEQIHWFHVLQ